MWRGANSPTDRIFASLIYMLPLADALGYGGQLAQQFPVIQPFFSAVAPFSAFTSGIEGLIVFILLLVLVINNPKISHFIRFNVMQAILLMIILTLLNLIFFRFLGQILGDFEFYKTFSQIISTTIFLGMSAACGFGIFRSVTGRYAEIPALSDVVYTQVR